MVDDAAWGTHDDLRTATQPGQLNAVGLAAVDRQYLDALERFGEGLEGVCHLQGQLTGWREHKCLRVTGLGINLRQNRQREGRGFAGTGLGKADYVAALHQDRDGFFLNGGRLGKAYFRNGFQNLLWQAKMREPLGIVVGRVLRLSAGVLRSIRSPGVLGDTLRVVLRFRLIKIFRLVDAAGGVIGNAHCFTNPTRLWL